MIAAMVLILRILRGFFGFFFVALTLQVLLGLAGAATHPDPGGALAIVVFKAVAALAFWGIYYGLYRLVNWVHGRNVGAPQPKLRSVWSV